MKQVQVRNLLFNDGAPKICIPLTGKTSDAVLNEVKDLDGVDFDLIELRIDHFEDVEQFSRVKELLENIRKIYDKPLLFTFRTKKEGGVKEMSEDKYFDLVGEIIKSGLIDLVDIELFSSQDKLKAAVELAAENQVKVVMSNHDFFNTPAKEELVRRLVMMNENGADIAKIAVMPNSEEDVLALLSATLEIKKSYGFPCITMSMGKLGVVTRLSGELFGSCLTFAAVKNTSAPGQINVKSTREILNLLKMD
ncbi:MAG: type I 3-dehydroquinate dehydratase [Sedimentibacter sp.]|uniref:type I 3-dehydroquinate dehydratase n=1 Tax=Sedimentibacter sp. TaxID=1960295 RepID=UPI003158699B